MVSAIISCPKCQTLVLSDTIQCPSCHHILLEKRSHEIPVDQPKTAAQEFSTQELPCKECGVMLRKGVVRCFNCGSFTNPEIEARFLEKQETASNVMYSDLPAQVTAAPKKNASSETSLHVRPDFHVTDQPDDDVDDDDFELADFDGMRESDQDDFDFEGSYSDEDLEIPSLSDDLEKEGLETLDAPGQAGHDPTFEDTDSEESEPQDDQLFSIAMLEEAEQASRKRRQIQTTKRQLAKFVKATSDGIVMLPPCRCCAIRIQPDQLGSNGVCPKCKLSFKIPSPKSQARVIPATNSLAVATAKHIDHRFTGTAITQMRGAYGIWLQQVWWHQVETSKFKPADDYFVKHYVPADLGFSPDQVVVFPLAKKQGTYASDDAKLEEARTRYQAVLTEKTPLHGKSDLDVVMMSLNQLATLKLIDPITAPSKDFEGVNVWGQGRIYLEVTSADVPDRRQFLSLTISQYREMGRIVAHIYGFTAFAKRTSVPSQDRTQELACMFSKKNFKAIAYEGYYLQDPAYKLNLIGYCCETCGKFLSEESRTDKKLGSAANKAPAKMKCLACGKKFGEHPRYELVGGETIKPVSKKIAKAGTS